MKKTTRRHTTHARAKHSQARTQRHRAGKTQPSNTDNTVKQTDKFDSKLIPLLLAIAVAVASIIVYLPAIDNQFVNWDDTLYVTENIAVRHLNIETLKHFIDTDNYFVSNYHPLTMISLAIDFRLSGTNPRWYHINNILFHTINTLLVFWFIYELIGLVETSNTNPLDPDTQSKRSWKIHFAVIVSALFAVHPLHVESVAWISQRKNVLYALFFFAALIAYVKYLNSGKLLLYCLTCFLFLLSLLSKGVAVSFAVTLPIIDYIANRQLRSRRVILEKIPFFAAAMFFGILAIRAQRQSGALSDEAVFALYERLAFASYGLTQYITKLIAPFQLSAIYSYPPKVAGGIPPVYWLFLLAPVSVVIAFLYVSKRNRLVAWGILFFLANIALVLQVFPVGSAMMADRYIYVPSVGAFILIAVVYRALAAKIPQTLLVGVLLLYAAALGYLTYERCDVWQDSRTLWDDVLEKDRGISAAWNNRGIARKSEGDVEGAISDYSNALELKPDYFEALNNRGIAKRTLGMIDGAIEDYNRSIKINPLNHAAYSNRANAKRLKGDLEGAIRDYDKAISLNRNSAAAYSNRGAVKIELGRIDAAIEDLMISLGMLPDFAEGHYNIGNAYFNRREFDTAINAYGNAIELRANYYEAYANRARAKFHSGDYEGAMSDCGMVIRINPQYADAYSDRGVIRYNLKDYDGAIADFNEVLKLKPENGKAFFLRGSSKLERRQKESACEDLKEAAQHKFRGAAESYLKNCR